MEMIGIDKRGTCSCDLEVRAELLFEENLHRVERRAQRMRAMMKNKDELKQSFEGLVPSQQVERAMPVARQGMAVVIPVE